MGKAYQLTSCETGKVLKALVPASRLKRCVDRSTFDKVHPPLCDQQKGPDETDTQSEKQSAVGASQQSPETPSVGTETRVSGPEWWPAKNIVRKRLTAGKLEFLVKFRDNTAQWIADADVSEELKRKYFIKAAAQRRSRQREYRARFKRSN
jgi:hypothetical protein